MHGIAVMGAGAVGCYYGGINGLVARKGEALGVRAPANRMLLALVKLLESEQGTVR